MPSSLQVNRRKCLITVLTYTLEFKALIAVIAPHYQVPDGEFFKLVRLPALCEVITGRIQSALTGVEFVAFTTDCWTNSSMMACIFFFRKSLQYLLTYTDITVTAHWINPKFELISACLKTCELPGSHTADVLAAKITEVSTQWKLNNRISGMCCACAWGGVL